MEALLTENGFIDNRHDAALMKQPAWREKVARGYVNGIAKAFNLRKKNKASSGSSSGTTNHGNNKSGQMFRVIVGSFQSVKMPKNK